MSFLSIFRGRRKKAIKSKGEKMNKAKTLQEAANRIVSLLEEYSVFDLDSLSMISEVGKQRTTEILASLEVDSFVKTEDQDVYYIPRVDETILDGIDYCESVEDDIWHFYRQTRSTDVLMFLTWLERKYSGRL